MKSQEEQIVNLAKKLIKFKTVRDNPRDLCKCADFIADFFSEPPFIIRRYSKGGKPSVVITYRKTKTPKVLLSGHFDVVAAKEEQFSPAVRGGKLHGRGAADMKGSVAVMMALFKELAKAKRPPSLGLMLTGDEEVGGEGGVGHLLAEKGYSSDLAVIPDSGRRDRQIITAQKGLLHLRIVATGKAAHGSRPWLGENAIDKLIGAYSELKKLFPHQATAEDSWYPTLNLGKIEGGDAPNKVPDKAEMWVDIRLTEREDREEIIEKVRKKFAGLKVEILAEGAVCHVPVDNPYIKGFVRVMSEVYGGKAIFERSCGASDARFFAEKGIPAVLLAPTCSHKHGKEEWVSVKSLGKLYEVLRRFILEIA